MKKKSWRTGISIFELVLVMIISPAVIAFLIVDDWLRRRKYRKYGF